MELLWWLIAIVLMAVGLIGALLPVLPGAIIILAAAVLHPIMLGPSARKTDATSRVDSALNLPCWKRSAMAGWRKSSA